MFRSVLVTFFPQGCSMAGFASLLPVSARLYFGLTMAFFGFTMAFFGFTMASSVGSGCFPD